MRTLVHRLKQILAMPDAAPLPEVLERAMRHLKTKVSEASLAHPQHHSESPSGGSSTDV